VPELSIGQYLLVVRDPDWDLRPEASALMDNALERCVRQHYVVEQTIESVIPGHPYLLMVKR